MKKNLLFILLFLFPFYILAQTEKLFTVNAELPNSLITALAQDSVGNIWIGTENGLCKYDGAKFTHFSHKNDDSSSLLSNRVSSIFVSADGHILIGSSIGLQIYDPDYNRFQKVSLWYNGSDTLPVHVVSIKPTPKGNFIVGSLGCGVFKVDKYSWRGEQALDTKFQNSFVTNMALTNDGNVWMSLARDGAKRGIWDTEGKLILTPIKGAEDWKVADIVTDSKGDAYYCTQDGVYKVSRKDLTQHKMLSFDKNNILSLLLYKGRILLIGTEGSGILAYDIIDNVFTDPGFTSSRINVSNTNVRTMLLDAEGNLWAGLYRKGVLACKSQSSQFEYIGSQSSLTDGILPRPVMTLYPDPEGGLWVAPEKDGLYAIKGRDGQVRHFAQGSNGLPPLITCVFKASDGSLWIGAIDKGLAKLDPQSGICTYISAFSGKSVFDIVEDKNHRLWIATMGEGLYGTDLRGNIEYTAPHTDMRHYTTGSDLLNNLWINGLTLSDDGTKLFINTCEGVGCYDIDAKSFVNTFGENRILNAEMCYDSFQDAEGYLWIATANGMYRWHKDDDNITHFDTSDGLCNNNVAGVVADTEGNIWFTTYYGLSKFDKATSRFTNYYAQDGIQGNEFNLRSMARDSNGKIYAGGLNGITAFERIGLETAAPKMRIADVYINDQQINYGTLAAGKPIMQKDSDGKVIYNFDVTDNSIGVELTSDRFDNYNVR